MGSKRERRMLWVILPIITLVCLLLWYLRTFYRSDIANVLVVESQTGEWDLTDVDFSDVLVRIRGDVSYIPGAVLTPEQFAARQDEAKVGKPYEETNVATSRIRLLLPDDSTYMIIGYSIDYAHRLYIGGEWRMDAGTPGETADTSVPGYSPIMLEAKPENGVMDIVQQSANFVHRESGGHDGFSIGRPDIARRYASTQRNVELVICGLFAALFLVHSTLYLVFRGYKSNLVFALLCFVWFVRTGVIGAKVFYSIFPALPWQVAFRAEYISLPATCILMLLLIHGLFPGVLQKSVLLGAVAASGAFAAFFLLAPTLWMSWTLLAYYGVYTVTILYLCARFGMKLPGLLREGSLQTEHGITLAALAIFMYAAVHDAFYYLGIYLFGIHFSLAEASILLFAFFQMTAMFYGTMRQVTAAQDGERRLAREKAALEELDRHKKAFYADISHEMKTPLTVIAANAQFAAQNLRAGAADAETVVDLEAISKEARRLGKMVSGLVGLSRVQDIGSGHEPLSLDKLVEQTARTYRSLSGKHGNAITVTREHGMPQVIGNADQLSQLLINLLSNATKHTQDGMINIAVRREGDTARVCVTDTGEGMDAVLLSRAFERFERGDADGSGLGLSICKTIVKAHGGEIGIESEKGKGTAVWFTLPLPGG